MEPTIALAGNPNSGKTTLFNALTGARQHVGNYPGVTVEKKQGTYRQNGDRIRIVDLPGTYSLTAYSLEEVVARDFLVDEKPGVVINIVDASNLERNLYLTLQFMEMGVPVCIALNMIDVAKKRGIAVDAERLSALLGIPVIPTVARNGRGIAEVMAAAGNLLRSGENIPPLAISYGPEIDPVLDEMAQEIAPSSFLAGRYLPRWTALKYLEKDEQVMALGRTEAPALSLSLEERVSRLSKRLIDTLETYPEAVIADQRYGYIRAIVRQGVIACRDGGHRIHVSDRIDRVVTHRFAGPIIMASVLLGLYHFTFAYSEVPVGWLEAFFGWLGSVADRSLVDGLVKSLIVSGIIDGVGGVLGFVPLILFMFLVTLISWTGALLVARLLRSTVIRGEPSPFVMELPPYRLPTFRGLFLHTWERAWQYIKKAGTVILAISILLWAMMTFPGLPESRIQAFEQARASAIATAPGGLLQEIEAADEEAQLSPRAETLKERLDTIEADQAMAGLRHSVAGRIGTFLEPVSRLAGFDWRTNIALLGGFAAKEVVVSTLATAYSLGEVDTEENRSLARTLSASPGWSPLTAWSLVVFTIFYAPCFVAVVCIAREAGSWKWGAFSIVFNTTLALALSIAVFQIGSFLK
ncbi:MAG: ferrous iron transporter B [Desulfobacterales bacterium]|nr:ferrous iron transporter B [Desulfobacterales bacterium]